MVRYIVTIVTLAVTIGGCATQRFGREVDISPIEAQEYSCRDIRVELSKNDQFLKSVRDTRSGLNGAQVLAIINDFGIGNALEGSEAEASGERRRAGLIGLVQQKNCAAAQNAQPVRSDHLDGRFEMQPPVVAEGAGRGTVERPATPAP